MPHLISAQTGILHVGHLYLPPSSSFNNISSLSVPVKRNRTARRFLEAPLAAIRYGRSRIYPGVRALLPPLLKSRENVSRSYQKVICPHALDETQLHVKIKTGAGKQLAGPTTYHSTFDQASCPLSLTHTHGCCMQTHAKNICPNTKISPQRLHLHLCPGPHLHTGVRM